MTVDRRKLRSVALVHLSWWRILTEAIVQHRHRGISDPDQAWLLGELIAYLDDERSGASGFQDMGENWVTVRNGAGDGTLRASDAEVRDVAARWEQFVEYLCLGLGQDLGRDVRPVRPRKQTRGARLEANCAALAESGTLEAAIRVPDAVGPLVVQADLRTRKVITSVVLDAPGEGRPPTRVNWLLRQLKEAPDALRRRCELRQHQGVDGVRCSVRLARTRSRLLLAERPEAVTASVSTGALAPDGHQARQGERSFVLETRRQAIDFYRELVQNLRPWRASAPKLPDDPSRRRRQRGRIRPPFSATDGRDPAEGVRASIASE